MTHPGEAAAATSTPAPIDWGTGTGWDVTSGAVSTVPLAQITGGV